MKTKIFIISVLSIFVLTINAQSQTTTDNKKIADKKYQAKAPPTQFFGKEAFESNDKTAIRWLGGSGFFVNSHGTTFMVDPVLKGFDMPIMIEEPIKTEEVPHLDAILITHSDNDHYSIPTTSDLLSVTGEYHSTQYVDSLMKNRDLNSFGHDIGKVFSIKNINVSLTPAQHAYQNSFRRPGQRFFKDEDACGFWIETPDGTIWVTGDSRLMPEHLNLSVPDAILLFYSEDSAWHFGLEGSAKIANAYPNTPILLGHWGTVDAPDFTPFNGDPEKLIKLVVNPERIYVLAPGEPFILQQLKK